MCCDCVSFFFFSEFSVCSSANMSSSRKWSWKCIRRLFFFLRVYSNTTFFLFFFFLVAVAAVRIVIRETRSFFCISLPFSSTLPVFFFFSALLRFPQCACVCVSVPMPLSPLCSLFLFFFFPFTHGRRGAERVTLWRRFCCCLFSSLTVFVS